MQEQQARPDWLRWMFWLLAMLCKEGLPAPAPLVLLELLGARVWLRLGKGYAHRTASVQELGGIHRMLSTQAARTPPTLFLMHGPLLEAWGIP